MNTNNVATQTHSKMAKEDGKPILRWSITKKIGGLSATLIMFILVIMGYTVFTLQGIQSELKEIAEFDVPLTEIATKIEINQLEQHIFIEKFLRLNNSSKNERLSRIDEIKQNFLQFSEQLYRQVYLGIDLTNKDIIFKATEESRKIYDASIKLLGEHKKFDALFKTVITIIDSNHYPDNKIIKELEQLDDSLDKNAIALVLEIEKFTERAAIKTEKHEQAFFRVNLVLSIAAVILGIFLSGIVIIGIKTNIFRLSKGITEVTQAISQKKALPVKAIDINSTDEFAFLAEDLSKMVDSFSQGISEKESVSQSSQREATEHRLKNIKLEKLNDQIAKQKEDVEEQVNLLLEVNKGMTVQVDQLEK